MRILLIGPPGAGKGTQATSLAERRGVPHIASGNLLREAIADGTALGRRAKDYMDRGELVPDDLVLEVVSETIRTQGDGFVLDGFPRTEAQAGALDRILDEIGRPLDVVILLDVPEDEVMRRLTGRRICPTCQRAYHMVFNPPRENEACDEDGTPLITRNDDRPETVRLRLHVQWGEAAQALIDYYEREGLVVRVEGVGEMDDVAKRIDVALEVVRT